MCCTSQQMSQTFRSITESAPPQQQQRSKWDVISFCSSLFPLLSLRISWPISMGSEETYYSEVHIYLQEVAWNSSWWAKAARRRVSRNILERNLLSRVFYNANCVHFKYLTFVCSKSNRLSITCLARKLFCHKMTVDSCPGCARRFLVCGLFLSVGWERKGGWW